MANVGMLRGFSFGVSRDREVTRTPPQEETVFYDKTLKLQPRRVNCGPRIGEVLLNPDGSVVVNSMQLARYAGYEEENHLKPADVRPLPDGNYLVSMRK